VVLLFHVDESADEGHHFHAGLLSDGPGVAGVETDLADIVDRAFDDGACIWKAEVHGVAIFHQNSDWAKSSIPRAIQVFDELLALLDKHKIEVIARGTQVLSFRSRYGADADPYVWNFSNLLERLNERLGARGEHGLVIADQQSQYKDALQRDLAYAREYGTGGYRSSHHLILDTAHFVDSRLSPMTQLVDVVTFVLRRRATRPTEPDGRLDAVMARWFDLVFNAVPAPKGQFHSIRST
jgi:hypothetical protein